MRFLRAGVVCVSVLAMSVVALSQESDVSQEPLDVSQETSDVGQEPTDTGQEPLDVSQESSDVGQKPSDVSKGSLDVSQEFSSGSQDPSGVSQKPSQIPDIVIPNEVKADGAFQYTVGFDIPKFRGLEPNLGLRYHSSDKSNGSSTNFTGVGWTLTGFSEIERVSIGGGTPYFDDRKDVFRLDGMELLACADSAAKTPYKGVYPNDFKTDNPSASCRAGGDFAPLKETFQKISYDPPVGNDHSDSKFTVYRKDGTRFIYRPMSAFAGCGKCGNSKLMDQSRYLLAEILDTQEVPNQVLFEYGIAGSYGYAPRPTKIVYGPRNDGKSYRKYQIFFNYEKLNSPLSSWATGAGVLAKQMYRLRGVEVKEHQNPIRAYGIDYKFSALTKRSVLTRITQYGTDYIRNANGSIRGPAVDAGTLARRVHRFEYEAESVSTVEKEFAGARFHQFVQVVDFDRDNKDELLFYKHKLKRPSHCDWDKDPKENVYSVDFRAYNNTSDSLEELDIPTPIANADPSDLPGFDGVPKGFFQNPVIYDYDTGKVYYSILRNSRYRYGKDDDYAYKTFLDFHEFGAVGSEPLSDGFSSGFLGSIYPGSTGSSPISSILLGDSRYGKKPDSVLIANLDRDPIPEVVVKGRAPSITIGPFGNPAPTVHVNQVRSFVDGETQIKWSGSAYTGAVPVDANGDGVSELLSIALPNGIFPHIVKKNKAYLSSFDTSNGFSPASPKNDASWISIGGLPGSIVGPNATLVSAFGDVNGDGTSDIVIVNSTSGSKGQVWVSLSNGAGFDDAKVWLDLASFSEAGSMFHERAPEPRVRIEDINGDGLGDLVYQTSVEATGGGCRGQIAPPKMGTSFVFLSDGAFFQLSQSVAHLKIPKEIASGDFDGDGRPDFAIQRDVNSIFTGFPNSPSAKIQFNTSTKVGELRRVVTPLGGEITVTYGPSTDPALASEAGAFPSVMQLVRSITHSDGRGQSRTTTYRYGAGAYDYVRRKSLGFRTVTACLPDADGTTRSCAATVPNDDRLRVTTIYKNQDYPTSGEVVSRSVMSGPNMLTQSLYTHWTRNGDWTDGNGPYRVDVSSKFDKQWFEGASGPVIDGAYFSYDSFGELVSERRYGYTDYKLARDGKANTIPTNADTLSTQRWFNGRNLDSYIVSLPTHERLLARFGSSNDKSEWLRQTYFRYDAAPNGGTIKARGNLTQVLEWTGNVSGAQAARPRLFTYDAHGNVVSETDPRGKVTTHKFDAQRKLFKLETIDPEGLRTTSTWHTGFQKPASLTDPGGRATTFNYDIYGRELVKRPPGGGTVWTQHYHYGNPNRQHTMVQSNSGGTLPGKTTNRVKNFFDGLGQTYRTSTSSHATEGYWSTFQGYDARGNLAWTTPRTGDWHPAIDNLDAIKTTFTYDDLGRQKSIRHPDGARSTVSYHTEDLVVQGVAIRHPAVTTRNEDCYDGVSSTPCLTNTAITNAFGNMIRKRQVKPNGSYDETRYTYNQLGELLEVVDPGGAEWQYTYNAYGERIEARDPALGVWTMSYDSNGNLLNQIDAKGQQISFAYNGNNQVTRKTVSGTEGTVVTNQVYGARNAGLNAGQLVEARIGGDHTIRLSYDITGQVAREEHVVGTSGADRKFVVQSDYDPLSGQLRRLRYYQHDDAQAAPFWTGTYDYDAAGRPISVSGLIDSVSYGRWGPYETRFTGGIVEKRDFDLLRGWIDRILVQNPNGTLTNTTYPSRSASGRVLRMATAESNGRYDYTYDYAGRLIHARNSWTNGQGARPNDQYFAYNTAGSMIYNSHVGGYVYDNIIPHAPDCVIAPQQLSGSSPGVAPNLPGRCGASQPGAQRFTFDANGNMLTGLGGKVMTYDGENRPLSVTRGGKETSYTYGADGKRLRKVERTGEAAQQTTIYAGPFEIRNVGDAAAEEILVYPHPQVRITARYTGTGTPHANPAQVPLTPSTDLLFVDQLGSVRATANAATGARNSRKVYEPFGQLITDTTQEPEEVFAKETKGFIGERYDEDSGLQFLNARYYDPDLAMFIQPDWFEVTEPGVGTNRYSYSFNDPVNLMDPGGNDVLDDLAEDIVEFVNEVTTGSSTVDSNGKVVIQSAEILRFLVPGQVAWDEARSAYVNGQYSASAIHVGAMVAEIGLGVFAGGAAKPLSNASQHAIDGVADPSIDLTLSYKEGWSAAQKAAADAKCAALCEAPTVVTEVKRSGSGAGVRYKKSGQTVPDGYDVDHKVDLQLGGADDLKNMSPLDASVNRSLGVQIQQRIKTLPVGTVIENFYIQ